MADWQAALARARAHSPFLAAALEKRPDVEALLAAGDGEAALALARQASADHADIAVALRREKLALSCALAVGDLAGAFSLDRVMTELSDFADRALDAAIHDAIARRTPDADPQGFVALALGKHGAQELNYSSDIDPILIYDPETLPRRARDEPAEAANRIARQVVQTLSAVTAEGYVFRVDLRLRPQAEITPLAVPVLGAISHYESSALTWERAAFLRARVAAGDATLGARFMDAIAPFVWRSSLDFGAIAEIRRLSARIRAEYGGPLRPAPGYDLKRGRGGIREAEFFVQTHQLIHGGRYPALRVRGLHDALSALVAEKLLPGAEAARIGAAYDTLREAEHRVQMVNDRQTHAIPEGNALDNVARLAGFADGAAWLAMLEPVAADVAQLFGSLLDEEEDDAAAAPAIDTAHAEMLDERLGKWRDGRYPALRSPAALEAFDAIRGDLAAALSQASDVERALARLETLLARLPSAINLFRLLEARPALLDQLVAIVTLAPPLAEELARSPELFDTLIDRTAFDLPPPLDQLRTRMAYGPSDYEDRLEQLRRVVNEHRFTAGVQLIGGAHDPLAIAAGLARVAEAAVQTGAEVAEADFARRHGQIAGGELVVLALGRLGGEALTHASDLDLVFLFDSDLEGESDGERPLGPTLYFNRLAQRVTAALSVPTAAGALYEVDTRLRPQGNQGPPAASIAAFATYQARDAWTWEHMALTRARVVVGSAAARARVEEAMAAALARPREDKALRADVLAMRAQMAEHKQPSGPLDAKLLRGGLVDLEFLVHFLQLREGAHFEPRLDRAVAALIQAGLLDAGIAAAHDTLARLIVAARLLAPDGAIPPPAAAAVLAEACGADDADALLQSLTAARQNVAREWNRLLGERLEIET